MHRPLTAIDGDLRAYVLSTVVSLGCDVDDLVKIWSCREDPRPEAVRLLPNCVGVQQYDEDGA